MSESSQASSPSSFFNLHVEGVGYLNRVRTIKPKKGQEFLDCTVAAMRGVTVTSAIRSSIVVSAVLTLRRSSSAWKVMLRPTSP